MQIKQVTLKTDLISYVSSLEETYENSNFDKGKEIICISPLSFLNLLLHPQEKAPET